MSYIHTQMEKFGVQYLLQGHFNTHTEGARDRTTFRLVDDPPFLLSHSCQSVYSNVNPLSSSPLCRKSHCGGKATWCGRACLIRPPSPLSGSRVRPPRRARWSRPQGRRAVRAAAPASPLSRLVSVCVGECRRYPSTVQHLVKQLLFVAAAGRKKGDRHTVI